MDLRVVERLTASCTTAFGVLTFWIKTKCPPIGTTSFRGSSATSTAPVSRSVREHTTTLGALPSPAIVPLHDAALSSVPSIGNATLERLKPLSVRSRDTGAGRL